jgi:hypothetical protein
VSLQLTHSTSVRVQFRNISGRTLGRRADDWCHHRAHTRRSSQGCCPRPCHVDSLRTSMGNQRSTRMGNWRRRAKGNRWRTEWQIRGGPKAESRPIKSRQMREKNVFVESVEHLNRVVQLQWPDRRDNQPICPLMEVSWVHRFRWSRFALAISDRSPRIAPGLSTLDPDAVWNARSCC